MEITEINLENCLSTTVFDPSPHRFFEYEKLVSERTIPLKYCCYRCGNLVSFKPEDFEKHNNSDKTNLKIEDKKIFDNYLQNINIEKYSFLDFYCPFCNQATIIIFEGGRSGYYGFFELEIKKVLVIRM